MDLVTARITMLSGKTTITEFASVGSFASVIGRYGSGMGILRRILFHGKIIQFSIHFSTSLKQMVSFNFIRRGLSLMSLDQGKICLW